MQSVNQLGVQTWSLRNVRDCAQLAEAVRACRLDRVELCDVHTDFNDPNAVATVARTLGRSGVKIVSIGVQAFGDNVEKEERWFESAAAAGAKHISAHFAVESFHRAVPAAAALCHKYDIHLGLHCHGGFMFGGQPDVLAHLLELGGPYFGITLDTAWCMQIGPRLGNPVNWVKERFSGRISCVHFKDFMFDTRGAWRDVITGTGNLDLPGLVCALDSTGFDGLAIIESDACLEDPVLAVRQCVQRIEAVAEQLSSASAQV